MTLQEVLGALKGNSALSDDDALALRRVIYGGSGTVTREEVQALFQLNSEATTVSATWRVLFVEAAVDLIVNQSHPAGYVDEDDGDWLVQLVKTYPTLNGDEVKLLIHVLERADKTPERLSSYVLEVVRRLAIWSLERSGQLTPAVLANLRRVIYAPGGLGNLSVTRVEAEALFDINDAMKDRTPDTAWRDTFVKAVAASVLSDSPWRPNAAREAHEEAWLADPNQLLVLPGTARDAFTAELVHEGVRDILHGKLFDHEMEERETADEAMLARASVLTEEKADWILTRIGKDGRIDANEVALIDFIVANAASLSPELQAGLQRLRSRVA